MVTANSSGLLTNPIINLFNDCGASRIYKIHVVPSGGAPATTNRVMQVTANTGFVNSSAVVRAVLTNGEFISIESDSATATQTA